MFKFHFLSFAFEEEIAQIILAMFLLLLKSPGHNISLSYIFLFPVMWAGDTVPSVKHPGLNPLLEAL